jgi:site-specific DNA-methyltransferase (adenine-specific)
MIEVIAAAGGKVLHSSVTACVAHADSRAVLRSMPDDFVDCVITDPPYDEETHGNVRSNKRGAPQTDLGFEAVNTDLWFLPDLLRVSRGWVICCCSLEQLGDYRRAAGGSYKAGGRYVRGGCYRRINPAPQISGDRPGQAAEGVAILWGGRMGGLEWNGGGRQAYWESLIAPARDHRHPTEKPEGLGLAFARDFTQPGDLVLDPFVGGAGLVAGILKARRRSIVGIELKADFAGDAARRVGRLVEDIDRQVPLFEGVAAR